MNIDSKIEKFREIIKNASNPIMFFDTDTDGITSYLILKNKYNKLKGYFMNLNFKKQEELAKSINHDCDLVIIFDIALLCDEFLETFRGKTILWMDHHRADNNKRIKELGINYLNPLNYDENDNRPASYFAYLICNNKNNLDLAVLGSVSDFFLLDIILDFYHYDKLGFKRLLNIKDSEVDELISFIEENHGHERTDKHIERDDWIRYLLYNSNLGEIRGFLDFLFKLDEDDKIADGIRIIEKLTIEELIVNINSEKGELFEDYAKIKKKYKKVLKKVLEKDYDKDICFYSYIGDKGFCKALSEELNYVYEDRKVSCVCFKNKDKDMYNCSLRGRCFDVRSLIDDCVYDLNANGGGHEFAVGLRISDKNFDLFKDRIMKLVKNEKYLRK
jgi:single-stranded DNA-specific DHH superfamily exonuclease